MNPSSRAELFTITASDGTAYDAFFDINPVAGGIWLGQVFYKLPTASEWTYLVPYNQGGSAGDDEFDASRMTTTADTDAEIQSVIDANNRGNINEFGEGSSEIPELGIQRAIWMLENGNIIAVNNQLKYAGG